MESPLSTSITCYQITSVSIYVSIHLNHCLYIVPTCLCWCIRIQLQRKHKPTLCGEILVGHILYYIWTLLVLITITDFVLFLKIESYFKICVTP